MDVFRLKATVNEASERVVGNPETTKQRVNWRNISISLIDTKKGEWKAQTYDIAWYQERRNFKAALG